MENKNKEITLKDLVNIFIPKLWIIAVVALVFAIVLGGYSMFIKKDTYTSSSMLYVYKTDQSATTGDITAAHEMLEIYETVLRSDDVLGMVIAKLPAEYAGINITTSNVRNAISFSIKANGIFTISFTTDNQALSFALAQSMESIAPSVIITRIPNALNINIIQSAKLSGANSKNTVRNTLIGFLGGAVATAVIIWLVSVLDVAIRDRKKIEDNFDFPVLSVIPDQQFNQKSIEEAKQNAV